MIIILNRCIGLTQLCSEVEREWFKNRTQKIFKILTKTNFICQTLGLNFSDIGQHRFTAFVFYKHTRRHNFKLKPVTLLYLNSIRAFGLYIQ